MGGFKKPDTESRTEIFNSISNCMAKLAGNIQVYTDFEVFFVTQSCTDLPAGREGTESHRVLGFWFCY